MKGIRRRIATACVSLGTLLFVAGVTSYFELARLNETTLTAVNKGVSAVDYSKQLLDITKAIDSKVAHRMQELGESSSMDNKSIALLTVEMDTLSQRMAVVFGSSEMATSAATARKEYSKILRMMPDSVSTDQSIWYFDMYKPSYLAYISCIKDFMIESQESALEQTKTIGSSAYRANMQGIVALAIAILLVIIFYFMLDTYFIKPTLSIINSLRNYLVHKIPFDVTLEGRTEIVSLKEYIEQLIIKLKVKK